MDRLIRIANSAPQTLQISRYRNLLFHMVQTSRQRRWFYFGELTGNQPIRGSGYSTLAKPAAESVKETTLPTRLHLALKSITFPTRFSLQISTKYATNLGLVPPDHYYTPLVATSGRHWPWSIENSTGYGTGTVAIKECGIRIQQGQLNRRFQTQ